MPGLSARTHRQRTCARLLVFTLNDPSKGLRLYGVPHQILRPASSQIYLTSRAFFLNIIEVNYNMDPSLTLHPKNLPSGACAACNNMPCHNIDFACDTLSCEYELITTSQKRDEDYVLYNPWIAAVICRRRIALLRTNILRITSWWWVQQWWENNYFAIKSVAQLQVLRDISN